MIKVKHHSRPKCTFYYETNNNCVGKYAIGDSIKSREVSEYSVLLCLLFKKMIFVSLGIGGMREVRFVVVRYVFCGVSIYFVAIGEFSVTYKLWNLIPCVSFADLLLK